MVKQIFAAALDAGLIVGCATFQPGKSVVEYEEGGAVRMSEAPATGEYGLFSGTDLRNPELRVRVEEGDEIGFVERDGKVYAVAGEKETPIQTGTMTKSYRWRRYTD